MPKSKFFYRIFMFCWVLLEIDSVMNSDIAENLIAMGSYVCALLAQPNMKQTVNN